ncbi:MAG: type II toxin-antitoxin system RelE/ParE family toxin [Cytophagales bacterium]
MKLFLSPLAVETLEAILDFIEENWSRKSREKALEKVLSKFDQIKLQPKSCPESAIRPKLFRCVVSKQTSFFYRILNDEIEVIIFIDNRQDPKDLTQILSRNRS